MAAIYCPAGFDPPGTYYQNGTVTYPTWYDPFGPIWFDQVERLRKADPGFNPYDPAGYARPEPT